jgi:hypothetical protein
MYQTMQKFDMNISFYPVHFFRIINRLRFITSDGDRDRLHKGIQWAETSIVPYWASPWALLISWIQTIFHVMASMIKDAIFSVIHLTMTNPHIS